MLPFKYRHNKIDQVSFRNISTRNQIYYLNVHVHANGDKITSPSLTQATLVRQLYRYANYFVIQNPIFEAAEHKFSNFLDNFYEIQHFKVTLDLKARDDEDFSRQFTVHFDRLRLIASDLAEIQPFDFEFFSFRIGSNFYTSHYLYEKMQQQKLLVDSLKSAKKWFL